MISCSHVTQPVPVQLSSPLQQIFRLLGADHTSVLYRRLAYTPTFPSSMWMWPPMCTSSVLSQGTLSVHLQDLP